MAHAQYLGFVAEDVARALAVAVEQWVGQWAEPVRVRADFCRGRCGGVVGVVVRVGRLAAGLGLVVEPGLARFAVPGVRVALAFPLWRVLAGVPGRHWELLGLKSGSVRLEEHAAAARAPKSSENRTMNAFSRSVPLSVGLPPLPHGKNSLGGRRDQVPFSSKRRAGACSSSAQAARNKRRGRGRELGCLAATI